MTLKEKYEKLRKTYSLPEYAELNRNFDIEDINAESDIILAKVRIKIIEKIEFYASLLESLVQPDTNLRDMYEAKHLSDNTREETYLLFKKLMLIIRRSDLVSLDNSEKANAEFINKSFSEWNSLKEQVNPHVTVLKDVWKKETNIKSDLSYFG
ncbi:MAG: hypothetical protein AABW92_05250 [Nanoarchaeota archaeon]